MERDKHLSQLLEQKEKVYAPDYLESQIMNKINGMVSNQYPNKRWLHFAWIYFIIGIVTGLIISVTFIDMRILQIIIQVSGLIVFGFLFEHIYKLTFKKDKS